MLAKKGRGLSRFRHNKLNAGLLIIATVSLGFAGVRGWDWYSHTQGTASTPNVGQTVFDSTLTPDEKPVSADGEYPVPADQPRKITIGSIGAQGFIQRVGKDKKGDIAVPTNIHYGGWYVNSAKPGDSGLSIIDGHVGGRYSSAIFAKLARVQKDDTIQIEFGDRSIRSFQVIDKRELPKAEAAGFLLKKQEDINQQLNLITCGGAFNKKLSTYNNRIILVAKRIN